jgi:predicted acetyltransferase
MRRPSATATAWCSTARSSCTSTTCRSSAARVLRGARGRHGGVGSAAARDVLARHAGLWNIAFQEENSGVARL